MTRKKPVAHVMAFVIMLCLEFVDPCAYAAEPQSEATKENRKNGSRTIVFTTGFPEIMPSYRQYNTLYKEVFQRMGYNFELKYHPDKRAGVYANSGISDGLPGRIFSFNADGTYPNIIRVDEPVKMMNEIAVAIDPKIKISGWEGLRQYKVTFLRGNKIIEQNIYKHVEKAKIIPAFEVNQAIRLLLSRRVDLFIEVREVLVLIPMLEEFKDKHFFNAGVVEGFKVYPFLHKNNKDLVPQLAETIRAIKKDGTYKFILNSVGDK